MKHFITILFVFLGLFLGAQINTDLKNYSEEILLNEKQEAMFIKLKTSAGVNQNTVEGFITKTVLKSDDYTLRVSKEEKDNLNWTHTRYKLFYKGVELAGKMIISHSLNGQVISINGDLTIGSKPGAVYFTLSEKEALNIVLRKVAAKKYKWENKAEEKHMREVLNQPDFSYAPKANRVIFEKEGKSTCAYKFSIYAEEPLYKANLIVDATTGAILDEQNLICTADVPGSAITKYSGTQSITCNQNGAVYELKETQRGNGIETYNLNYTSTYANTNFTNSSTSWTATGADQGARDAHWGAEKTYDYYFSQHNRNSIDNNGFKLLSYVHYNTNYANAFWDGVRMTYGDGNGTSTYIFTTIDICGHEITHGLTSNTSDLNYSNESGALNESYSDIFGTLIENYGRPSNWNWRIGEQMTANGNGIRNMLNPAQFSDPDTYGGQFWYTGTADNGGVHTNSGVSNFWFYLLSIGGSGTNDLANPYNVTGIGLNSAAQIAFRALTVYYTPTTNYAQARALSIQAAKDIFGNCSNEVTQTTNAWHAVGVGGAFVPGLIGPDFTAFKTNFCALPATVNFNNTTTNGISYVWHFGDGSTSTSTTAAHTYTANGSYTVMLKATGCSNGLDSIIKPAYIVVNAPSNASASGVSGCANNSFTLSGSGSSVIKWYAGSNAIVPIGVGSTFVTPNLSTTTTYYVANTFSNTPVFGGMLSNTGGNFLTNPAQYLVFDVSSNCTLNSVVLYAQTAGNRIIELRSSTNVVINSTTVNLSVGANTVSLYYFITPGNNYQLGLAPGSTAALYRSNTGVSYPYPIAGCLNIKGSSAGIGFYYWFYNWEVSEADCTSPLLPVTVTITPDPQVSINAPSTVACIDDNSIPLTGTPPGGIFNGTGVVGSSFMPSTGAGNYAVIYNYNSNGCSGADTLQLQVAECVGLKQTTPSLTNWHVFPNPANEYIQIDAPNATAIKLEISDAVGRIVFVTEDFKPGEKISIRDFAKGVYMIQTSSDKNGETETFKFIKE